ncbi:hypothetical protein H1R20_g5536, partial [Candolleomyces eurysporus]
MCPTRFILFARNRLIARELRRQPTGPMKWIQDAIDGLTVKERAGVCKWVAMTPYTNDFGKTERHIQVLGFEEGGTAIRTLIVFSAKNQDWYGTGGPKFGREGTETFNLDRPVAYVVLIMALATPTTILFLSEALAMISKC